MGNGGHSFLEVREENVVSRDQVRTSHFALLSTSVQGHWIVTVLSHTQHLGMDQKMDVAVTMEATCCLLRSREALPILDSLPGRCTGFLVVTGLFSRIFHARLLVVWLLL